MIPVETEDPDSLRSGRELAAAQEADLAYRAQRHAELTRRLRAPIRLIAYFDGDRPIGFLLTGISVGMSLAIAGIIRGDPDFEPLPWELPLGLAIAVVALILFAGPGVMEWLRKYLHGKFEREGLTFDEPRGKRTG